MKDPVERFWRRVDQSQLSPGGCWEWNGARNNCGYGVLGIMVNRKLRFYLAHRFAYEQANAVAPGHLLVRHRCDNPGCVNPAHLEIGTQSDNMKDCVARGRFRPDQRRQSG